ncbi:hypothetical protein BDW62DRAFT_185532 [Aspergillus aurantiobrunneus]
MKSAISPDIWETKRMLITKLYKDEEWPLKQVIKLVQTRDFHPSESQLRSRLKKWHITKPSRKKYDGSRRLSGAKKNSQKRPSDSHPPTLPSSSTYNTLQSHPRPLPARRTDESDSFSEGLSEASRPSLSIPDMSTSPANQYILPSSPHDEAQLTSPIYGSNPMMAPSTPITPAFYGLDDSKRVPGDAGHPIYFYPQESSPSAFPASTGSISYSAPASFNPFSDPSLAIVEHPPTDLVGYPGVHYLPSQSFSQHSKAIPDLPPPLLDGSWVNSHPYLQELAPPIYQTM